MDFIISPSITFIVVQYQINQLCIRTNRCEEKKQHKQLMSFLGLSSYYHGDYNNVHLLLRIISKPNLYQKLLFPSFGLSYTLNIHCHFAEN